MTDGLPAGLAGIRIAGIVLAGGRGSRVDGADKSQFRIDGIPLLQRAFDALAATDERIAVGSPEGRPAIDDVRWVREDPPFGGPVAALSAALAVTTASEVMVLPADLPGVAEAVDLLLAHALDAEQDGLVLTDPDGREQWLTARYRTAALSRAIAASDAASMRAVMRALRVTTLPAPASATRDIDTWEDLHQANGLPAERDAGRDPRARGTS